MRASRMARRQSFPYNARGGEKGPVILPAFKAGDSVPCGRNGGFDSHTLPPISLTLNGLQNGEGTLGNIGGLMLFFTPFSLQEAACSPPCCWLAADDRMMPACRYSSWSECQRVAATTVEL